MNLLDQEARFEALNTKYSFIVQAPAGSGKTGLLTLRFLSLLCKVKIPEECLAVTFTRKAAAEMRDRILGALLAAEQPCPVGGYKEQLWHLAKAVLHRDLQAGWNLQKNIQRLRILTIDALCAHIVRRSPMVSEFGGLPEVTDNSVLLYQEAAERLLMQSAERLYPDLLVVCSHLDNKLETIKDLFVSLLSKRDQWLSLLLNLRGLSADVQQQQLTTILENIFEDKLDDFYAEWGESILAKELAMLVGEVANNVLSADNKLLLLCRNLQSWPLPKIAEFSKWHGLCNFLLTKDGKVRKNLTKKLGFLAPSDAACDLDRQYRVDLKKRGNSLLDALTSNIEFVAGLQEIASLPIPEYSSSQSKFLESLINLLPILVAELILIFKRDGKVDFLEIALGAQRALREADLPTDLALELDSQINHILIDEFQDTSFTQWQLLLTLTAGWDVDDGRTLFIVGDPMQSIYRFRQADVSLFIKAQQEGLPGIPLKSLNLITNFRANNKLVAWNNKVFSKLFCESRHAEMQVPFISAVAFDNVQLDSPVSCHQAADDRHLAVTMIKILQEDRKANPSHSIAILVRARTQLLQILPELKKAGIPYVGTDIERLNSSKTVSELIQLTKSLFHLADNSAWLSLLRSPWIGINLSDILKIVEYAENKPLLHALLNYSEIDGLTTIARQRLNHPIAVLKIMLARRKLYTPKELVWNTWRALGGELSVLKHEQLAVSYFWQWLNTKSHAELNKPYVIEEAIEELYSPSPRTVANAVQIMTIHKSKGLEFDIVYIPYLEKMPAQDKAQLLRWRLFTLKENKYPVFVPIKAANKDSEPLYKWLGALEKKSQDSESIRLLYVAVTRAKYKLRFLACKNSDKIPSRSFLAKLQDHVLPIIQNNQESNIPINIINRAPSIKRLTISGQKFGLKYLAINDHFETHEKVNSAANNLVSRLLGILFHEIVHNALIIPNHLKSVLANPDWIMEKLTEIGVPSEKLSSNYNLLKQALTNTANDQIGQWLLSNKHDNSYGEWEITSCKHGKLSTMRLDRVFKESNTNNLWIVDYKVTDSIEPSLDVKQYLEQLNKYRQNLSEIYPKYTIKCGLYFPVQPQWIIINDSEQLD